MPHTNYPYGQLKGKTYYADKDDLYPIIKDHLNKPVTLQTKDGYSHNGYVQHIDDENVYLGVPNNVPGPAGVQPGYQGYPQQPPYVPTQPYAPTQPYGGYPNANPYMNSPYTPYRDDEASNETGSREHSQQRIFGGFGPGFGGYGPGYGGYGPGFGGYGAGYGGYGPGFGGYGAGYGGYGPGFGGYGAGYGGGLSSLIFPLASLAALSV
jgi:hypothetical protein